MQNNFEFHNIDRSEALEGYVEKKTEHLHLDSATFNWYFSKDGHGNFQVKCVFGRNFVHEEGKDLSYLVSQIVKTIKSKETKFKERV